MKKIVYDNMYNLPPLIVIPRGQALHESEYEISMNNYCSIVQTILNSWEPNMTKGSVHVIFYFPFSHLTKFSVLFYIYI